MRSPWMQANHRHRGIGGFECGPKITSISGAGELPMGMDLDQIQVSEKHTTIDPIVLQAQNRANFQNFSFGHLVDGVYTLPSKVNYGNYRVGDDRD